MVREAEEHKNVASITRRNTPVQHFKIHQGASNSNIHGNDAADNDVDDDDDDDDDDDRGDDDDDDDGDDDGDDDDDDDDDDGSWWGWWPEQKW